MHSAQLTNKTFATFPLTRVRNIANTRFQWIKQPIATKQFAISSSGSNSHAETPFSCIAKNCDSDMSVWKDSGGFTCMNAMGNQHVFRIYVYSR